MEWKTPILALLAAFPLASARLPPPALHVCSPGPFIVFFESDVPFLGEAARKTLETATTVAGDCGDARIVLAGHIDTNEKAGLDKRRIEVVRDYLAARGIPRSYIRSEALGSRKMRVTTGPNVSEAQNRRVEIIFTPPD